MTTRKAASLAGVSAFLFGAFGAPSFAQETDQPQSREVVVVTAQRREEALIDVPISITAVSEQDLVAQGIKDVRDLARVTPGLQIRNVGDYGGTQVVIRGIFSSVGDATTGVYINDSPVQQRNDSFSRPIYGDLFDVERVEVLRGPQGTLFGAGSEGGTLRFITVAPSTTDFSSNVRSELATTKLGEPTYELGAAIGGPIIEDKLGLRISLFGRHQGGWIDNVTSLFHPGGGQVRREDTNDIDTLSGRFALKWTPTDRLTIRPEIMIQNSEQRDTDLAWERAGRGRQENMIRAGFGSHNHLFSNTVEYEFDPFTVTWVASYLDVKGRRGGDGTWESLSTFGLIGAPGTENIDTPFLADAHQDFRSSEIRIESNDEPDSRFSWVGGVFWDRNTTYMTSTGFSDLPYILGLAGTTPQEYFGPNAILLPGNVDYYLESTTNYGQTAVFGDVSYNISDRLKVTGGLRIAESRLDFHELRDGPWNSGFSINNGRTKEHPVTPKITLSYDNGAGVTYATISKGYRAGGVNTSLAGNVGCAAEILETLGTTDVPLSYKSDSLINYEAGMKRSFLDDRLFVGASAFVIDWKDIQGPVRLQCFYGYTGNLGKAISQGGDLTLRFEPVDGLILGADLGYTDAHFKDRLMLSNGVLLTEKGQPLPAPKYTVALSAAYDWIINSGMEGYARADYNYSSAYSGRPPRPVVDWNELARRQESVTLVSARAGIRRGPVDFSVFVDNLFDSDDYLYRTNLSRSSTIFRGQTVRPRTIGVTMVYRR